jgi:hypothetical protein
MHDCAAIDALTAKVDELARTCTRLSTENAELRSQLSALFAEIVPAGGFRAARIRAVDVQETADVREPSGEAPASGTAGERWRANDSGTARISRRAAVGAAVIGAAAGIAGMRAATERDAPPSAELTKRTPTAQIAARDATEAGLTAADQAASPTATGSVISGTLSTASAVLAGTNTHSGAGVAGTNTGSGPGVAGTSAGVGPGVSALNSSTGPGLRATSDHGRGGIFSGAVAQIQLNPGAASHPRSGWRGDLYADGNGRLWYCKKTGATALWHQIA